LRHRARAQPRRRRPRLRSGRIVMTRSILHMLSPLKHMSPFDGNLAAAAGVDIIVPYTGVTLAEVGPLVQDTIFSRAPQDGVRTGIFLAGKNAELRPHTIEARRQSLG